MGYSVEIRVEITGIPHAFLVLKDNNGREISIGFAPEVTGLSGTGKVFDEDGHPYDISSTLGV